MASDSSAEGRTPPYLPFSRFSGFIESLKEKTLPSRFDRTLMRSMSGADQSQLGIALRFFKLIEGEDKKFTEHMSTLVAAAGKPAEWKMAMGAMVSAGYRSIVGDLDSAATQGQLTDAFRDKGLLKGSALAKAMRFYLSAARAGGLTLSPHYTAPAAEPNGERAKKSSSPRTRRSRESGDQGDTQRDTLLPGRKVLRFTVPAGEVQVNVPEGIPQKQLDAIAGYLKQYTLLEEDD